MGSRYIEDTHKTYTPFFQGRDGYKDHEVGKYLVAERRIGVYSVGDLVQVKVGCEGRIPEVWGEPMKVIGIRNNDGTSPFRSPDKVFACKFTPDGNTWFARDGIINYFTENEIEYREIPKPTWEV